LQSLNVERANIYQARVNRHLIILEMSDTEIRIVRILHEAMDIPRHLKLDS
jgi:plasmid stabilization system protein ParE